MLKLGHCTWYVFNKQSNILKRVFHIQNKDRRKNVFWVDIRAIGAPLNEIRLQNTTTLQHGTIYIYNAYMYKIKTLSTSKQQYD